MGGCNKVSDVGCKHIALLKELKFLHLKADYITDTGVLFVIARGNLRGMKAIVSSCHLLNRLYLSRAILMTSEALIAISLLPSLVDFEIHCCPNLTDAVLNDIPHNYNGFAKISRFVVSKCKSIFSIHIHFELIP